MKQISLLHHKGKVCLRNAISYLSKECHLSAVNLSMKIERLVSIPESHPLALLSKLEIRHVLFPWSSKLNIPFPWLKCYFFFYRKLI